MEEEKLKLLRKKIPVSLTEAINLLKDNNGNIEACEKIFHTTNVDEICEVTKCDRVKADKIYKKFNFNKQKAIKSINNEQVVITTDRKRVAKNSIGFILWFEDENEEIYETERRHDIFIPTDDFDYIYKIFASNCLESFDATAENYFTKNECHSILEELGQMKTNENLNKFIEQLIEWMESHLEQVTTLVVYGNL